MTDDGQPTQETGVTYQISADESPSEGVVRAVSAISGSEPVPESRADVAGGRALEPLYAAIDPEALDSVFRSTASDAERPGNRITFSYHGYRVTVRSDGSVSVEPRSSSERTAAD